jgi:hypothetical protein
MRHFTNDRHLGEALRAAPMALALLACSGCIMVPVPMDRHKHGSRHAITDREIAALVPGETTLTQVLLRFGEPEYIFRDDSLIGYNWDKVTSELWVFGQWFDDDDFRRYKYGQTHNLDLTFDAEGKLLKHNLRHTSVEEHTK